ncbi:MAG: hypothetical protein JWO58_611 [Chitinophagaceae bacterium]|nr:hypothetical protein [Chitinophagaceae bacterium]
MKGKHLSMKHLTYSLSLILLFACPSLVKAQQAVDNVIFGVFCGHCSDHCAILYAYSSEDSTTLYVDSTDSYFRRHDEPIVCKTPVHDAGKIQWVRTLINDIPDDMLYGTERNRTFGCPDCSDACGIYMEFMHHQNRYRFYIDTQPGQLNDRMKVFVKELKEVVSEFKKRPK